MNDFFRRLHYFFFGQAFADGVRTTVAILVPALLGVAWGQLGAGITASIGALCVSLPDSPGPDQHRRNAMLASLGLVFATALLTGVLAPYRLLLGLEIAVLSFGLTMLLVWGPRAGAVGTAALLSTVLVLAHPPALVQVLPHAGLLLLGGTWYLLLALLVQRVRPYWAAQQALGECLHALAGFLHLKARFYDPHTDLDDGYQALVRQQVVVNEKQEAARDLLFRTRQLVNESTATGRRLVLAFVETVDLYETASASYYNYAELRRTLNQHTTLATIGSLVHQLAAGLTALAAAVQAGRVPAPPAPALARALAELAAQAAAMPAEDPAAQQLPALVHNLHDIARRVAGLRRLLAEELAPPPTPGRAATHARFVVRQELLPVLLVQNLTMRSSIFRHALRMMLACVAAFILAETLWQGAHNYWVLMTVTVMLKPGFSLTRARNTARIKGTLAGGLLGAAVLATGAGPYVLLALLVLFMVLSYSFQRTHYAVSVVFLTAFLLIAFSFEGLNYLGVIQERVLDTLLGCAIAFGAGYFLFPRWEAAQLSDLLAAVLRANQAYLSQLADRLAGRPVPATVHRLVRKDVYVASANLAAAFERMLTEPRAKQHRPADTHQFVVLSHILTSGIAALAADLPTAAPAPPEALSLLTDAQASLAHGLFQVQPAAFPAAVQRIAPAASLPPTHGSPLLEQLVFLCKVSADIERVSVALA